MPLLLSLGFGGGMLLIYLTVSGRSGGTGAEGGPALLDRIAARSPAPEVGLPALLAASGAAAGICAVVAQLSLGWPVVTLSAGAVGLMLPSWYLGRRRERRRAEIEDAVGETVETLRDAVRIGMATEEALRAVGRNGPVVLRPLFREMERDFRLVGFEEGLGRARRQVDVPLFDTLAVALLTSYRLGGRNLAQVLDGLSRSVRGDAQARREVRAAQAQNVLSARIVAALPLALILVIRSSNPAYLDAFSRPAGQVVLALCLASVALGYAVMLRAAALPADRRVLR